MENEWMEVPACAALLVGPNRIIAGRRHSDCIISAVALGLDGTGRQGFMTTHGRFVTREIAMDLMKESGKPVAGGRKLLGSILFSEDLY